MEVPILYEETVKIKIEPLCDGSKNEIKTEQSDETWLSIDSQYKKYNDLEHTFSSFLGLKSDVKKEIKQEPNSQLPSGTRGPYSDCPVCKKYYPNQLDKTKCGNCLKDVISKAMHICTPTYIKPYTCKICVKSFLNKQELLIHNRIHTGRKSYKCEICLKQFSSGFNFLQHSKIHIGERHKCKYCWKSYSQKSCFDIHSRTHSKNNPFQCNICLANFPHRISLIKHSKIHKGEKSNADKRCEFCLSTTCSDTRIPTGQFSGISTSTYHSDSKPSKKIDLKHFSQRTRLIVQSAIKKPLI